MQEYPWYDVVEESEDLEQGDFIDNCDVLIPEYIPAQAEDGSLTDLQEYEPTGLVATYNVVIVSQSCDLENGKLDYVLMCPMISYSEHVNQYPDANLKAIRNNLEEIRLGRRHRYCMLGECKRDDFLREIQIVDLGTVFSVPYNVMKHMARSRGKRLRLLSPYKEKLAQAFAYYYMRVALPIDIPIFDKGTMLVPTTIKTRE